MFSPRHLTKRNKIPVNARSVPGSKPQVYNSRVGSVEAEARNGMRTPQWKVGWKQKLAAPRVRRLSRKQGCQEMVRHPSLLESQTLGFVSQGSE